MDSTPVLIEEEPTVRVARISMAELVFGDDEDVCQVCADRGTVHTPEEDL